MLVLMPAYAKLQGAVGEGTIGVIYAINTVTILLGQIPITRLSEGRRRMPLLALGTSLWVVSTTVPVEQESSSRAELFDRVAGTFKVIE